MKNEEEKSETFTIRPPLGEKFNSVAVKELLKSVMIEQLDGKKYNTFNADEMVHSLGKLVVEKLKDLPFKRYKYLVNVTIAEQKGQAMRCYDKAVSKQCQAYLKKSLHILY